jgi:virulence factor Mce-like protein
MPVRRSLLVAGVAAAVLAPVLAGCGGDDGRVESGTTRIDAIFDNASFVNAGQDVRVAGATVGKVSKVTLTKDRKALISMQVENDFAPFRKDADCTILPQSLIGEKFVECDPGKPSAPVLAKRRGQDAPTLPIDNTHSPVDLDLVVAMLGQPTNVRFQLLLNEFGAGLSTRGKELDDSIRRANPTLKYAKRTLDVLNRDRQALGRIVTASDEILTELNDREGDLTGTFEASADVLKVTSDYRVQLDRAIRDLPPTLREIKPALRSLRDLSGDVSPTLVSLRQAAPALRTLSGDLGPLSDAARPALRQLARTSNVGVPILQRSQAQLNSLQAAVASLTPIVPLAGDLNRSLSDNGVPENLARFVFNVVMATARKDDVSHIVPANVILTPCLLASVVPQPGCEATFPAEGTGNNQLRSSQLEAYQRLLGTRAKAQAEQEDAQGQQAQGDGTSTGAAPATTPAPAAAAKLPALATPKEAGR